MLFQIAWRNIWRSKLRSMIVIGSVLLGVWALSFLMSFNQSMINGYVDNAIRYQTSHLQIHLPEFVEDREVEYLLPDGEKIFESLKSKESTQSVSLRTSLSGMIKSPRAAQGITITGVIPSNEKQLTRLDEKILEGEFLDGTKRNQIIVSQKLAEKLKLKLRKKVQLQFQDVNGEFTGATFRIVGIFKTGNTVFDLSNILVNRQDLNRLLGQNDASHEIALLLKDKENMDAVKQKISMEYPELLVEDYREISPDVKLYEQQIGVSLAIFGTIFMLALIFGIINTMLMAVLERNREIGMLMAVGMNKLRVFGMIVLETLLLGMIGAPIGLFLGYLTITYFGKNGIDLGSFAEGAEQFGVQTIIKTELEASIYIVLMIAVLVTALLASIYPSFKAIKLKPVEAIRKI